MRMTSSAQHPPNTSSLALPSRPSWVDEFARLNDWRREGREGEFRALLRTGELEQVGRGVARWVMSPGDARATVEHPHEARFRARIRASMLVASSQTVVSHSSAAMLWGMRTLEPWPTLVDHTVPIGRSSRSSAWVRKHVHSLVDTSFVDDMPVTTAARTVIDVARAAPRAQAFELSATAMFAPRRGRPLVTLDQVLLELESLGPARGVRAARSIIESVGVGCESPAEARSLLLMMDAGFERPLQQHVFRDRAGDMVVDCWWPDARLVGECDGLGKYLRHETGNGRGAADAVMAEKRREDRLRALGVRVVRWTTETLRDARAFAVLLTTAGVPLR